MLFVPKACPWQKLNYKFKLRHNWISANMNGKILIFYTAVFDSPIKLTRYVR